MPARRRNPDSRTVRIVAYVSRETEARLSRHAAALSGSLGAALDDLMCPRTPAPTPTATRLPHEFTSSPSGLVKLCTYCGAGEKSAEGRSQNCPNRR